MSEKARTMSRFFPIKMWKRIRDWLAVSGITLAIAVRVFNGYKSWQTPFNKSEFDIVWAIVAVVSFLIVGLFFRWKRGRVLISLITALVTIFVLFSIFNAGGLAFLVLIWLLALSGTLGNAFLKRFFPSIAPNGLERSILSIAFGFGALSFLIFILGLLQVLYSYVVFAIVIVLSLFVFPSLVRSLLPVAADLAAQLRKRWQSSDLSLASIVFSAFMICLLGSLVWALSPAIQHDALRYHLGAPVLYVQNHGLIEIPEDQSTYYAHNAEMMYTLALILAGQPLPSLLHLSFGVLATGVAFALGSRVGGTRVGVLSAILFFTLPLVTWQSGTADIDMIVTLFTCGSIYCVVQWWWIQKQDEWLTLAGIAAGLGLGTKLNAVLVILPLSILVLIGLLIRTRSITSTIRGLVRFNLPAFLLLAPWLIREWIWTGNPIFPYFYGTPEGYRTYSGRTPDKAVFTVIERSSRWNIIIEFVRFPWDISFRQFDEATPRGRLAGISLVALPWFYLRNSPTLRLAARLSLLALATCILWVGIFRVSRYLLPILPVFAILAAVNLDTLWQHISLHRWNKQFMVIALVAGLCYLTATRFTSYCVRLDDS